MNLARIDIPGDADPATTWAVHHEFDLRWRRWRRYRLGALGVSMSGVTAAMKRFTEVLVGTPE